MWSTPLNGSFGPGPALADGNGGILVNILPHPGSSEPAHLTDLDAQTGAIIWHYDESDPFAPLNNNSAIGLDGTVYAYGLTLDGATGALLPSFFDPTSLGQSSITINFSCNGLTTVEGSTSFHPFVPPPTIDGDGTRFSVAMVANAVYTDDCSRTITLTQFSQTSFLIRADSNGSVTLIPYVVYNNSSIIAGQSSLFLNGRSYTVQGRGLGTTSFRPVPDGLGGVFVPWWTQPSGSFGYQPHLTHVPQSGTMNDLVLPLPGPGELEGSIIPVGSQPFDQFQMVLGENNVAYASDLSNMIAFDLTSGQTFWSYATPNRATIIESLAGLGLAVKTTNTNRADTIVRLDSTGTAIADLWQAPQIDYIRANAWTGISPDGGAAEYYAPALQEAGGPGTRPAGDPQHNWTPDPGLVLVATQDCHKFNPATNIYARYPVYKLRLPSNKTKTPSTNYTVFEFVPANPNLKCVVLGGLSGLGPCRYADGSDQFPFNEFDDEISAGLSAGFDNIQYFLYGSPNQRFWGVKQIFRTLPDNALQPKQGWNRLTAKPQSDPLIDGQLDPWLAPWDGSPATCNSDFSTWFPRQ